MKKSKCYASSSVVPKFIMVVYTAIEEKTTLSPLVLLHNSNNMMI